MVDAAQDRPVEEDDTAAASGPGTRLLAVLATAALVAGTAIGLLLGTAVLRPSVPPEGSVEVGFARDMAVHHAQAVQMSVLVRERSNDPEVRQLALDIELTQQHQQGQMFGWLATWGLLPTSSAPPMAWAGGEHGAMGGSGQAMPGLVTPAQLDRLEAASGADADVRYLALMIPHHQGGAEMAEIALREADQPAVRRLAEAVVAAQQAEVIVLEQMLAERGGPPADL